MRFSFSQKSGKWNAMHVRIAWEIYNHQHKEKASAGVAGVSALAAADKDKWRAFPTSVSVASGAGVVPPPNVYRSPYELAGAPYLTHHPHLGAARYDERAAYAAAASLAHHTDRGLRVAGVSPFARYGPAPYPGGPPPFSLSAYSRDLALTSSLHGVHHAPLAMHDPWRTAAARPPQAPPPLAAADAARREHEERERERARRDRDERERRDRDERERRKAREHRDREIERARVRSPLRNGTLEPKEERKEMPRPLYPPPVNVGAVPPAWDPYRVPFDPLQHMRFAPLVEAAIRAEEDRAKMFSAYAHHQQLKAGAMRGLPPLAAHGMPPMQPPLQPLDLLKKEEPR